MPHKDPEKRKEYNRKYHEKNKEKKAEYNRKYNEKNKEYYKDYVKKYYEKNKEKIAEYDQTPARKKSHRIYYWKRRGVICDDWDVLYERYLNTEFCELCNIKLTEDKTNTKTTRCLDHDHNTGEFRNVVCWLCNIKRR